MEPSRGNKTGLILGIVAFVILVIIGVFVLARPKVQSTINPTPTPTHTTTITPTTPPPPPTTTKTDQPSQNETGPRQILIQSFSFQPASLTVKKGTVVTWTNQDSAPHTVTSDSASAGGPNSPQLTQNQTYSFTFNTVGAFAYHCSIHPNMHGMVTVTN